VSYAFEHLELIEEVLRRSPFGLITDVDGTISQTTPTPQQASVSPVCRHYLSLLCSHIALVSAISGRPTAKAKDIIKIDGTVYIGNYGLERWTESHSESPKDVQDYLKVVKAAVKGLTPLLPIQGVTIEDKGITATIHYRLCPEPRLSEKAILAAIEDFPHARRMIIDLLPQVDINKGMATLELIRGYKCRAVSV